MFIWGSFTNLGVSSSSSEVGPPKKLLVSNVTDSSFAASWTAAPGNVQSYQIKWKSMFSEESGQKTVPGHITTALLDGLSPETLFQVSVVANYQDGDSGALTGQETTDGTAKTLLFPFMSALLSGQEGGQRSRGLVFLSVGAAGKEGSGDQESQSPRDVSSLLSV